MGSLEENCRWAVWGVGILQIRARDEAEGVPPRVPQGLHALMPEAPRPGCALKLAGEVP